MAFLFFDVITFIRVIKSAIGDGVITFMWVFYSSMFGLFTTLLAATIGVDMAFLFFVFVFGFISGAEFNPTTTVPFYVASVGNDNPLLHGLEVGAQMTWRPPTTNTQLTALASTPPITSTKPPTPGSSTVKEAMEPTPYLTNKLKRMVEVVTPKEEEQKDDKATGLDKDKKKPKDDNCEKKEGEREKEGIERSRVKNVISHVKKKIWVLTPVWAPDQYFD